MTSASPTEASAGLDQDIEFDAMVQVNTTGISTFSPLVSDELRNMLDYITRVIIGQFLALFGMGSNIINISVFYKMGFKESINVSLFGLSISDFMSCLTMVWANLCTTPSFNELDLPFHPFEIRYITGGWPHVIFVMITSCITTSIAFERCLCVTFPLKVKNMVTPKKVTIFLACTYTSLLSILGPLFYINRPAWKFYPALNKTLVGLVFSDDRMEFKKWIHPIVGAFLFWLFFTLTIIFTAILVVNLKRKTEWRQKAVSTTATTPNTNHVSSRDAKVSKMVVSVCVVFIVCFTPFSITSIVATILPSFAIGQRYENIAYVVGSIPFMLESINASLNIFIYYFRSSKYKSMFDSIFFKKKISD